MGWLRPMSRLRDYGWFGKNAVETVRAGIFRATTTTKPSVSSPVTLVLLPGVYEDPSYFQSIRRQLEAVGYAIATVPQLGRMRAPVHVLAKCVLDFLTTINGPIILLAHSKGSLVGRAVLAALPTHVRGMIAFAAPWRGSTLARLFPPFTVVGKLVPDGPDVTQGWSDDREKLIRSRIYSLSPSWDPHIPGGSVLPGAHNIQLSTAGHFRLIADPKAFEIVVGAINELLARPDVAGSTDEHEEAG